MLSSPLILFGTRCVVDRGGYTNSLSLSHKHSPTHPPKAELVRMNAQIERETAVLASQVRTSPDPSLPPHHSPCSLLSYAHTHNTRTHTHHLNRCGCAPLLIAQNTQADAVLRDQGGFLGSPARAHGSGRSDDALFSDYENEDAVSSSAGE